jgi:SAM-dependent methyltransferase
MSEPGDVAERYARRAADDPRYRWTRPEVWQAMQERQRVMLRLFVRAGLDDLSRLRLYEVGCGSGGNLLEMLRLGFAPQHLAGIDLLPERVALARARLPSAVAIDAGDALEAPVAEASQDIVLAATVFSSLLDESVRERLAQRLWSWLKPGGAVLWYDFAVNNPRNPDVRGVPDARLRTLFPQGDLTIRRVTLAPPIARRVVRLQPALYTAFNLVPLLRTHRLAWIRKP